jgi:hypothetical protein
MQPSESVNLSSAIFRFSTVTSLHIVVFYLSVNVPSAVDFLNSVSIVRRMLGISDKVATLNRLGTVSRLFRSLAAAAANSICGSGFAGDSGGPGAACVAACVATRKLCKKSRYDQGTIIFT